MKFISKKFNELTVYELYEILKSRTEVFLLEQNIVCQDMDGVDLDSLHCFLWDEGRVKACLRAYYTDSDTVKIGRVLTLTHGEGHGKLLMDESLRVIKSEMPCKSIVVSAQTQAQGYYEKCGFKVISNEYIEDGIPHVKMML